MPKVKRLEAKVNGAKFEATLNVSSGGQFSVILPGTQDDWPGKSMKLTGFTAAEVENEWHKEVSAYAEKCTTERKVIVVRFDSKLRTGGRKNFFTDRDTMLVLEATIAIESTTTQGGEVTHRYRLPEEFSGLHCEEQPFPSTMILGLSSCHALSREDICVVDWTKEVEAAIAKACFGIKAIVDALDKITSSPERLAEVANGSFLLASQNQPAQ